MGALFSLEFWKSIPAVIQLLLELKKLWDQHLEDHEKRERLKQFKEALERARSTGDTSDLVKFVNDFGNSK